ncbi:MAG: hypothetical protein QHH19_01370 [Candidatus Thermoplasmatota archaeon]|jgi:hypothetical protein|nr:hypothetical protein [Candidatus Thermoplasmatota archaeon]
MEKRTIFLELPLNIIDEIDLRNTMGDRSLFITELLEKQLQQQEISRMNISQETETAKDSIKKLVSSGIVTLVDSEGTPLGRFDINTVEGFEDLARKICEISEDPMVRIKARRWY